MAPWQTETLTIMLFSCFRKVEFCQHAIDLSPPVLTTGSPKAVHVLSCVVMHVKGPQLYVVRIGHCAPLAGLCLFQNPQYFKIHSIELFYFVAHLSLRTGNLLFYDWWAQQKLNVCKFILNRKVLHVIWTILHCRIMKVVCLLQPVIEVVSKQRLQ